MISLDYKSVEKISNTLGIGEYYRYLPLLFTYRTINSTKKLGEHGFSQEEKEFIRENDEINLEKISN